MRWCCRVVLTVLGCAWLAVWIEDCGLEVFVCFDNRVGHDDGCSSLSAVGCEGRVRARMCCCERHESECALLGNLCICIVAMTR